LKTLPLELDNVHRDDSGSWSVSRALQGLLCSLVRSGGTNDRKNAAKEGYSELLQRLSQQEKERSFFGYDSL
jgi:hypothetical protein